MRKGGWCGVTVYLELIQLLLNSGCHNEVNLRSYCLIWAQVGTSRKCFTLGEPVVMSDYLLTAGWWDTLLPVDPSEHSQAVLVCVFWNVLVVCLGAR